MSITADLPNIRVRFEPEVLETLRKLAKENERSVAAEVRYIVRDYINHQPIEEPDVAALDWSPPESPRKRG